MNRTVECIRHLLPHRWWMLVVLAVCLVHGAMVFVATAGGKGSHPTQPEGGYALGRYVIASGGTLGSISPNYIHLGTAGQTVVDACQGPHSILGSGLWHLAVLPTGLALPATPALPTAFALFQNYPNPFNPTTIIKYDLPRNSMVRLSVYDILGREVSVPVNERQKAGAYECEFKGNGLASGVYIYRLVAGDFVAGRKMILTK